jgi:hypothetical protein
MKKNPSVDTFLQTRDEQAAAERIRLEQEWKDRQTCETGTTANHVQLLGRIGSPTRMQVLQG